MLLAQLLFDESANFIECGPPASADTSSRRGNRKSLNATQSWDKKFDNTCHWRKTLEQPKICLCFARTQSHTRTEELSECERRNDSRVTTRVILVPCLSILLAVGFLKSLFPL